MIIAAAVRRGDRIHALPAPARHHDVLRTLPQESDANEPTHGEQGFIDSELGFVTRGKAYIIATASGQIVEAIAPGMLTSEDVWNNQGKAVNPPIRESDTITLPQAIATRLNQATKALGQGIESNLSVSGAAALAVHWNHRAIDRLTLSIDHHTWAMLYSQPAAREHIQRRFADEGAWHTSFRNDGLQARWGKKEAPSVWVRTGARPLRDPRRQRWIADTRGVEIERPAEILYAHYARRDRPSHLWAVTDLFDIAWSKLHAADEYREARNRIGTANALAHEEAINRTLTEAARGTPAATPVGRPPNGWTLADINRLWNQDGRDPSNANADSV